METTDNKSTASNENPRRFSTPQIIQNMDPDEVEPVVVKPSTELIPDEYDHKDNTKGFVLIFHSEKDEDNVKALKTTLLGQGYKVPDKNIHRLSTKQYVIDCLQEVSAQDHKDKSCLLFVIMGNAHRVKEQEIVPDDETDLTIKFDDIWPYFTSTSCPSLRYKPKILLFQVAKRVSYTTFDSRAVARRMSVQYGIYDIPAEADMLLILHTPGSMNRTDFVEDLCEGIKNSGKRDDVIELVTKTEHADGERRPLLISTFTSKFYFTPNNKRGYHHDLHEYFIAVDKMVNELNGTNKKPMTTKVVKKQTLPALSSGAKPKAMNKREGVSSKGQTTVNKPSGSVAREVKEKLMVASGTKKKQVTTMKTGEKETKPIKKI